MLTNNEVIAIDQAGNPASPVSQTSHQQVWYAYNNDGTYTVALFNLDASPANVTAAWSDLGFVGTALVHDAWSKSDVGNYPNSFSATLPGHGSRLLKVTPPAGSPVTSILVSGATSLCMEKPDSNAVAQAMDVSGCSGGTNQKLTYSAADETLRVSGMCLDARNRGTAPTTVVQAFQCNGQANQKWAFHSDFTITGVQSNLCLDVKGGSTDSSSANAAPIILFECNGGLSQKWYRR